MNDSSTLSNYGDLASSEVVDQLPGKTLILPVGAIEQHGPHLPLTVDLDIANALAIELARRLDAHLAPGIAYGARSLPQSGGGPSFPGTISVRGTVLIEYFTDILSAYARCGPERLIVLNGHYENEPFLFEAMEVCREAGRFDNVEVISLSWWSVVSEEFLSTAFNGRFPGWHAEHAGLTETSLMLYLRPDLVREVRPEHSDPPLSGVYLHPIDPQRISDRGVLARTADSSVELGAALFEHVCNELTLLVQNPHGMAKRHQARTRRVFVGGPIRHAILRDAYDERLRELFLSVLSNLKDEGYEVFSAHLAEDFGLADYLPTSRDITLRDFDWMSRCDTFVAILPDGGEGVFRTDGTHVELGWASVLKKPIIAVVPLPLPENYGHLLRGLDSIAKVRFVDISLVQKNPLALAEVLRQPF